MVLILGHRLPLSGSGAIVMSPNDGIFARLRRLRSHKGCMLILQPGKLLVGCCSTLLVVLRLGLCLCSSCGTSLGLALYDGCAGFCGQEDLLDHTAVVKD